jgi:hypothetical protein
MLRRNGRPCRRRRADRERRRKWVQPAQARQGAGSRPDHDPFPFRRRRWVRLLRGRPAGAGRRHRPYKPKEEPASYLAELLLKILEALHARPVVAKVVVLQLSSNPILEPLLAERLLLALAALGVPTEARPKMYQRAMGVIFEMILAECGRSSAAEQKQASAQMHETIATLPSTEFPNLTELREAIVAETVQAGAAKPSPEVLVTACRFAVAGSSRSPGSAFWLSQASTVSSRLASL